MAGRKPKPTAIKELEGNPGKRKLNKKEPKPEKGMLVCPEWLLPEAKVEWKHLSEKLNQMGVLTEVDMAAFAAYCQSYARWKEAQEHNSIAYELHTKAIDILEGRRVDPTFYPVVYGLKDDEDWEDEANWYKVNPSLGYTVDIERLRDAYREAKQNPADEITFRWLRMNQWVSSTTAWIPDQIYQRGNAEIDLKSLEGRDCYGGLDLSSTGDITAFVLMFPPKNEDEKYILLPFFWVPEETIPQRVKANSVPYDVWERQGYLMSTEGNVIHSTYWWQFQWIER